MTPGGDMDNFLNELRTQYWYWFVRSKLMVDELQEIEKKLERASSRNRVELEKKREIIKQQIQTPKKVELYTRKYVEARLTGLQNKVRSSIYPLVMYDKYRNGTKKVSKNLVPAVDELIPGSANAYEEGPAKMFRIMESETFPNAIILLIREFLRFIFKSEREWSHDQELVSSIEKLVFFTEMYGPDVGQAASTLELTLDMLCENRIDSSDREILDLSERGLIRVDQLDPFYRNILIRKKDDLFQEPSYISLREFAVIYVSLSFLKAKFLGETLILSRCCFKRRYLKVMEEELLMSEVLWFFDVKNKEKVEPTKSKSPIKFIFQRALSGADKYFPKLEEDWGVDLSLFRDKTET